MTVKRWFFRKEKDAAVYLYDTPQSDPSTGVLIKNVKSKTSTNLGPVLKIETTEGKSDKVSNKYGVVHGLYIECVNGKVILNRELFIWNANDFCKRFKGKNTAMDFVEEWDSWLLESEMPPAKKFCSGQDNEKKSEEKWLDDIDEEIEKHRVGKMEIVISQLMPPQKERLLRKIDPNFVKALKSNMIRDPTNTGVPPAVIFTNQVTLDEFNPSLKDAYKYEVAGGLHGYTAKAELHSEVPLNPYFKTIQAEVYCQLSDEHALRLALRHNMNGHFIHKMTFRDIVEACRARLVAMTGEGKPLKPTAEWRTACKTVIIPESVSKAYKNEMLRLAVVSDDLWKLYIQCFDQYEAGDLKGQTLTSKQLMTKPEVKQTQFQCLLPLKEDVQLQILTQLTSHELSLKELKKRCEKEKKLSEIQDKFVHLTNCKSWTEASAKYPIHTKLEKLEQFLSLNFTKKNTPQTFSRFCAGAVMSKQTDSAEASEIGNCKFVETSTLNGFDPTIILSKKFKGASLFILYMDKDATLEMCEQYVYTCCQINAQTLMENYNIILYGEVEQIQMAKKSLDNCTKQQSVLFCCNSSVVDPKAKVFTSNVTAAVVGHWSNNAANKFHFNFSDEDDHKNFVTYSMEKRSASCSHQHSSIKDLLQHLLKLLTFPGETVIEFFPIFGCGDLMLLTNNEVQGRDAILVAKQDTIQCAMRIINKELDNDIVEETELEHGEEN